MLAVIPNRSPESQATHKHFRLASIIPKRISVLAAPWRPDAVLLVRLPPVRSHLRPAA